jgi:hypothetical protein
MLSEPFFRREPLRGSEPITGRGPYRTSEPDDPERTVKKERSSG